MNTDNDNPEMSKPVHNLKDIERVSKGCVSRLCDAGRGHLDSHEAKLIVTRKQRKILSLWQLMCGNVTRTEL